VRRRELPVAPPLELSQMTLGQELQREQRRAQCAGAVSKRKPTSRRSSKHKSRRKHNNNNDLIHSAGHFQPAWTLRHIQSSSGRRGKTVSMDDPIRFKCPICGALPNDPCVRIDGTLMPGPHGGRKSVAPKTKPDPRQDFKPSRYPGCERSKATEGN